MKNQVFSAIQMIWMTLFAVLVALLLFRVGVLPLFGREENVELSPLFPHSIELTSILIAVLGAFVATYVPQMVSRSLLSKLPTGTEFDEQELLKIYFPVFLIRLGLLLGIELVGFAASISVSKFWVILPFSIVSILGFIWNRPGESSFRALTSRSLT